LRTSLVIRFVRVALAAWVATASAFCQNIGGDAQAIWVALASRTQLKAVASGTVLDGKLTRGVYWRDSEIFAPGSTVRLVVDQIQSRRRPYAVDDRPFFIHLFAPRHEWMARFRSVAVLMPGGARVPLRATFIELAQRAEVRARSAKAAVKSPQQAGGGSPSVSKLPKTVPPWVLTLQAEPEGTTFAALAGARAGSQTTAPARCPAPCTLADGTRLPVVLLEGLSASKNHQGQSFQAVLLQPVMAGERIAIPQGSIVEGVLASRVPPRRLYRPGSLHLLFTRLALPSGAATAIAASPLAAEVDRGTHMTMDSEGRIHAQNPGTARFLIDFGVTGGISKLSDDTAQLIIEAISSTATDASTAGVARFAAIGASGIFLLTRHGRDVILPPYTEMDVSLNRAVTLEDKSTHAH